MIPGVVLAGGASSRMQGRPKALLPAGPGPETFLERIVSTLRAGGVDDVVIVTGHHHDAVGGRASLLRPMVRVVRNPRPEQGQLSSLLAALGVVDHPGVRAMLVTLVDLPLVSAATVRAVLDAHRRTGALPRAPGTGRQARPSGGVRSPALPRAAAGGSGARRQAGGARARGGGVRGRRRRPRRLHRRRHARGLPAVLRRRAAPCRPRPGRRRASVDCRTASG